MNKIDAYLVFSAAVMLLYTAVVIIAAWHGKLVPAELTVAVFAAFGSECWACAWIKRLKLEGEGKGDGRGDIYHT